MIGEIYRTSGFSVLWELEPQDFKFINKNGFINVNHVRSIELRSELLIVVGELETKYGYYDTNTNQMFICLIPKTQTYVFASRIQISKFLKVG